MLFSSRVEIGSFSILFVKTSSEFEDLSYLSESPTRAKIFTSWSPASITLLEGQLRIFNPEYNNPILLWVAIASFVALFSHLNLHAVLVLGSAYQQRIRTTCASKT